MDNGRPPLAGLFVRTFTRRGAVSSQLRAVFIHIRFVHARGAEKTKRLGAERWGSLCIERGL
eukprot:COSAG02_NODE_5580_length_4215_cov_2.083576_5_plen_62_part_00